MYSTPILYIVFNRPEETAQSFEVFRKLKPARLYIAADGARYGRQDDVENTQKVKQIVRQVDWDCEVKTLYHPENKGCRIAVQMAIDWFFENEPEGIIIEDDIIPNNAFFEYCQAMLEKYRDDDSILTINGCSLGYQNDKQPYGKTRYFNMWGWATWRNSVQKVKETWANYDPKISLEADAIMKKNLHLPVLFDGNAIWAKYWEGLFLKVYENRINTWDYQWCYSVLKTDTFCIRPSQNYVVNIGSGELATHHNFDDAPIFHFTYTATHFTDKKINPKIDFRYEIFHVGAIVNSHYFRTLTRSYLKLYLKNLVKKLKAKIS
ncbi:nucleotide-diphospho-sugar transferase [Flavobacterium sp.]|uniref:nucleotide-diphospho-sugar transferase n=1 Tax=Flavobacterium sp. TaxID=239 RepID=UPI002639DD6E|nr:nucleotide-diphospho-sugar transferase [Flavobacterium sp.]